MKITANQNLIPYFQPSRETLPADQPDAENRPELNRRSASEDSLRKDAQAYRYYIKENIENSIYNSKKNMIPQLANSKGVLIDIYA